MKRPPNKAPKLVLKPKRTRAERAAAQRFLSILKTDPTTRRVKVKCVKRSVRLRAYENDLKLSIAVDRMARELAG
ncbi:MAG TPA: hypothetical protein VLI90_03540 [Tepidisphaeraceae bacterium]|nr:hypothetical protein [Tepidisphaeraceae bacterium]